MDYINLDPLESVKSPTDRSARSKSLAFIDKIVHKSSKNMCPEPIDPCFRDFNYFCENPDDRVEIKTLRRELHPKPRGLSDPQQRHADAASEKLQSPSPDTPVNKNGTPITGTPLSELGGTPLTAFMQFGLVGAVKKESSLAGKRPPSLDSLEEEPLVEELVKESEFQLKELHLTKLEEGSSINAELLEQELSELQLKERPSDVLPTYPLEEKSQQ